MKVAIAMAIYFMSLSTLTLASCLDEGMLKYIDKSAPEVSMLAFAQCVMLNQCKIARNELKKVKNYDTVTYSFLKCCALANWSILNRTYTKQKDFSFHVQGIVKHVK